MSQQRPQVTAYFDEPDERTAPFFLAIGQVILAVGGLEYMLLLEIARLFVERSSAAGALNLQELSKEVSRLERLTAGQRLGELRKLELSPDLDQRIGAVIDRRNEIVHHLVEDPQVIKAMGGEGIDVVVKRFEQLALDAAALAAELHLVAAPKLEVGLGVSQAELMQGLKEIDPKTIDDPLARRQVEAAQALGEIELPSWESE